MMMMMTMTMMMCVTGSAGACYTCDVCETAFLFQCISIQSIAIQRYSMVLIHESFTEPTFNRHRAGHLAIPSCVLATVFAV